MFHYDYTTKGTCSKKISLDLDEDRVKNVVFYGGCAGNLLAIPKLVEGMTVDEIEEKLLGNPCGDKGTSCADQLAKAVRQAYDSARTEKTNSLGKAEEKL